MSPDPLTDDEIRAILSRPALVAPSVCSMASELLVLRARLAQEETAHGRTIDQRDDAHEWADRLAAAVAPLSVIGEHSSANNPWANAVEVAAVLRARLAAVEEVRDPRGAHMSPRRLKHRCVRCGVLVPDLRYLCSWCRQDLAAPTSPTPSPAPKEEGTRDG